MTGNRTIADRPGVVSLDDGPGGTAILGAKAENLARARAGGLPVIDGFVIPPALLSELMAAPRGDRTEAVELLRTAWGALSHRGSDPVVVRSSSVAEDTSRSSHAGVFDSVVDVHGWDDFLDAVRTVARSAARAEALTGPAPLAILVQRHLDPSVSGVMFTVDPVTGRTDHLVVAVVEGGPQALVSGEVTGARLVLDRRSRIVEGQRRDQPLSWRDRAGLARLARRAELLFGGPQDIEWAIERSGHPVLLQSRPVTAVAAPAAGPVFGPGPIAETFPDPLRPLEQDLWLPPLREALRVVLQLTGSAPSRALARSPIVITVAGRPAIDLDLLEAGQGRRRGWALLDPRGPVRRLRVAWQVGRLRTGMSGLIDDVLEEIDGELTAIPRLDELAPHELLRLLERTRIALRSAHGYELLAGALTDDRRSTGSSVAVAALARGRQGGASDADLVSTQPVVLALTAPAIGPAVDLPPLGAAAAAAVSAPPSSALGEREALRLRIRWLHELSARAAWALGQRLAASGHLREPDDIVRVRLATLSQAVLSGTALDGEGGAVEMTSPLPARFRLRADGSAAAVVDPRGDSNGTPAGGGRASGVVAHAPDPPVGSVLVVDVLDPRLAPSLAGLAGLVAATGSPLSHLAILAREHGIPTVVGVPDALRRFPPGTEVLIDGATGEVRALSVGQEREGVGP